MKIEIFKIKKKFKKGGFHINPNIGWKFILFLVFFMIIISIIFGFYLFYKTNEEFVIPSTGIKVQDKIVKKERLEKVLEYFFEREKKSAVILNSPSSIVDPSL
ncbi:MAG: hypothetical protein WC884_03480 [Candidatus Paceibacterota bacterium]